MTMFDSYISGSLLIAILLLWPVALASYRLLFSPIAHFPGPKLTAATGWYETYYDIVKGGQFIFQIEKWHRKYGPIIRINPWEIHIYDPDFYNEIYSNSAHYDKNPILKNRIGIPLSMIESITYQEHKRRRSVLGQFFTRQRILQFSKQIQSHADRMGERIFSEYAGTNKPLNMTEAWAAYAADIITWYTMALRCDFMDSPDFIAPYNVALHRLTKGVHVRTHFPWIASLLHSLPESIVQYMNTDMAHAFRFQADIRSQILRILSGENAGHKTASHATVFHTLLDSDLSKTELTLEMLQQEAASLVGAATDTMTSALAVATYHILANYSIHAKLYKELKEAIPDQDVMPPLVDLEKLPYLGAVIQESLRLSYGVPGRLTRINRQTPTPYKDTSYIIPRNTPFSMSSYLQLRNPAIFTNPDSFKPERWLPASQSSTLKSSSLEPSVLEPARASNGNLMSKYQVIYSSGPRMCVGRVLADAELVIGIASLFRRFADVKLAPGMGRETVEMAAEYFMPHCAEGTNGVIVIVD